jgi:hypothetical protein
VNVTVGQLKKYLETRGVPDEAHVVVLDWDHAYRRGVVYLTHAIDVDGGYKFDEYHEKHLGQNREGEIVPVLVIE